MTGGFVANKKPVSLGKVDFVRPGLRLRPHCTKLSYRMHSDLWSVGGVRVYSAGLISTINACCMRNQLLIDDKDSKPWW
jgi:hypothetical protein